jgi:FAD/FMN-containing dehydrogenase
VSAPEIPTLSGASDLSLLSALAEVGYRRPHVVAAMPAPPAVVDTFERLASAPASWREDLVAEFDVFGWTRVNASDRLFARSNMAIDADYLPQDTLLALAAHVRRAFGLLRVVVPEARFRFELRRIDDDGCCKFHVDHHAARLLFTYVGAGTQWVEDGFVDRAVVGDPPIDVDLANAAIVRDLDAIRTVPAGEVMVMAGTGLPDVRVPPTVHRSPPTEASPPPHRRFVLTITALAGCGRTPDRASRRGSAS